MDLKFNVAKFDVTCGFDCGIELGFGIKREDVRRLGTYCVPAISVVFQLK